MLPKRKDEQLIPYDVKKDEAFPSHPFFTEEFQSKGIVKGTECARTISNALQTLAGPAQQDPHRLRLVADAKGLSQFESQEKRTIAVLGDSGEGASRPSGRSIPLLTSHRQEQSDQLIATLFQHCKDCKYAANV